MRRSRLAAPLSRVPSVAPSDLWAAWVAVLSDPLVRVIWQVMTLTLLGRGSARWVPETRVARNVLSPSRTCRSGIQTLAGCPSGRYSFLGRAYVVHHVFRGLAVVATCLRRTHAVRPRLTIAGRLVRVLAASPEPADRQSINNIHA
jgi:hypothetical protein